MLLKVDNGDVDGEETAASRAGHTEFISHTIWAHQIDYKEWKARCVEDAGGRHSNRSLGTSRWAS